jgi:hypothetical protein
VLNTKVSIVLNNKFSIVLNIEFSVRLNIDLSVVLNIKFRIKLNIEVTIELNIEVSIIPWVQVCVGKRELKKMTTLPTVYSNSRWIDVVRSLANQVFKSCKPLIQSTIQFQVGSNFRLDPISGWIRFQVGSDFRFHPISGCPHALAGCEQCKRTSRKWIPNQSGSCSYVRATQVATKYAHDEP